MAKPFIDDEQLQNLKQLLQSNDNANQQLAFSLLQGFQLPLCFLNELRSRYPMACLAYGFYVPFQNIRKISLKIPEDHSFKHLSIYKNPKLEELNLDLGQELQISQIPDIWHFTSLKKLSIKGNWNIQVIPEQICLLKQLTSLSITDCGWNLSQIPEEVCQLKQLQTLNLQDNRLEFLPEYIGQLTNLRALNLRDNWCISSLPESLGQLKNLKILDLRGTGIRDAWEVEEKLPDTKVLIHPMDVSEYV